MPDDTTIRLEVEGGYLALARSIVVEPDGNVTIEVGGRASTARLDAATIAGLQGGLDDSGLFVDGGVFEAEGADLQRYTVTYRGSTVIADDGVVPETLTASIAELEQLILANR